ncbi:MAG: arabinosyltransferase [Pseudonocardiaceae bacterium]|nr:arabinosyltransferase [Pseudonocardiaceae bacterium]
MSRPASTDPHRSRRTAWTIAALALLTGVLGILVTLAPVTADDPVVNWPRAGEEPTSTVLPLSPYRPLQLDATVPCATLAALDGGGGGDALRTMPADLGGTPGEGLVVAVESGTVTVTASGRELLVEPLPAGDCAYHVSAAAGGVRVARDGAQLATAPALLPPQVAELATAAQGLPQSAGLAVELHTDARFESSPTPLKIVLLVAHALSLVAVLALAWRHWRGSGPGLVRPRLSGADGVVIAVSLAWVALGPIGIDDSWYLLMARNATESGYFGNYVSQLNAAENPFVASQYPMLAWGALGGWSLAWMRLLPLAYGLATYALLRVLLATVLGRVGQRRAVPWALALGHLVWWLPYGIALRPEPLIVLCSAGVLVLAELARRRESVGALAAATVVATLGVAVSPTGLVAAAPLVFALPWLWRWLRAAGWPQRAGAVLLAGASASVMTLPAFADATLGNVVEATAVHRWYYRSHPWHQEILHYAKILEDGDPGAWGKRLPVLLTLAVLLGAAIALGRRAGTGGPLGRLLAMSAGTTAVALALMSLTPTKWVNHFGAVAASASVLLAAAALRSPVPRRAPAAAVTLSAIAVGVAAAVGYAGPNLWRPFADWGMPFGDHTNLNTPYEKSLTTPGVGPVDLHNPLVWLAVAAAAVWWARRRRRRGLATGPRPDRALLVTAGGLGVVLMLAVFSYAPLRQYPGPSLAMINAQSLTGSGCGLAGDVRVFTAADRGLGPPLGAAQLRGDMRAGPLPARSLPGPVWHDDVAGGASTGAVITPWYPLPEDAGDGRIVLPVSGELSGQRVALQFRVGAGVRTIELHPGEADEGWTRVAAKVPAADGQRPNAVRAVAEDIVTGPGSWLAVGRPRLTEPGRVSEVTAGRPVFADQASAALWPCVDQIAIANGIAQPPRMRLRTGDGLEHATEENTARPGNGGTLAQVDRTVDWVELPSSLAPRGVPTLDWGHIERAEYVHPPVLVDLRVDHERRWGWEQRPTLARQDYSGRKFIG